MWFIIHNKVYDVTQFQEEHPGGNDVLKEHGMCFTLSVIIFFTFFPIPFFFVAGKDGTQAFEDIGHSHDAVKLLENYYIGDLDTAVGGVVSSPYKNQEILKHSTFR